MAIDPREGLYEHSEFMGLRNTVPESGFALGDLSVALNVDIDDVGHLHRRKGTSAVVVAGVDLDLWASGPVCLGVGSNALKQINPNYTTTTLRTGLIVDKSLSYAAVANRVYYANGVELGCVQDGAHRTWGITPPTGFIAAATGGDLQAGKYQVAVTYVRDGGQESGAARATVVEVAAAGGISLTNLPVSTDPTVDSKRVYVSPTNGETMFLVGIIGNNVTTFAIRESRMGAAPLTTQFLLPPPAGDHIAYFNGLMLVASGDRLYPSEAYAPELFDFRKAVPFLDKITMIAPVDDGVWIGTGTQVIWITGDSPDKWVYRISADYGVTPGTLSYGDGEILGGGDAAGSRVAFFTTKNGICAGRNGGSLSNLTQARFSFPSQPVGAGVCRKQRGTSQYLVTLRGSELPGSVA